MPRPIRKNPSKYSDKLKTSINVKRNSKLREIRTKAAYKNTTTILKQNKKGGGLASYADADV